LAVVAGGNYGADHEKIRLKAETKKLKPDARNDLERET
jgi:hypothetical protein